MDDFINETSVETAEVAEQPTTNETESVETVEVAEQPNGRTPQDTAFAEMRRRAEEAERQRNELEEANRQMSEALGLYFDGESPEDLALSARAYANGTSLEQERAQLEAQQRTSTLEQENERLNNELVQLMAERQMAKDLAVLQGIDPNIKSLDEMDETFFNYITAGLSAEDAYYASKAKAEHNTVTPAKPVGDIKTTEIATDYFTREQVDAMSDAEIDANFETIKKSMSRW